MKTTVLQEMIEIQIRKEVDTGEKQPCDLFFELVDSVAAFVALNPSEEEREELIEYTVSALSHSVNVCVYELMRDRADYREAVCAASIKGGHA